jgi:signal transduction histidine kinase
VLELSRIEAEKAELVCAPVNLSQLVSDVVQKIEDEAERRENRIATAISGDLEDFNGDGGKIRQVLAEIVENGVKFTRSGTINIMVSATGERPRRRITISVTDTGIGIPDERLPFIFEQFSVGGDRTGGEYDGAGLGLALARKLAQFMRGNVQVTSEVGRGSTFRISLSEHVDLSSAVPLAR